MAVEQVFVVPAHARTVIDYWVKEWGRMWREETPFKIHSREISASGAPEWTPEFRRWIDRGFEESGVTSRGRHMSAPRNPDQRLRTTRAFRKLRRKNVREYEVLYRTVVMHISLKETAEWLTDRAIRNEKPERYTEEEARDLAVVGGGQGSAMVVKVSDDHVVEYIRSYWTKWKYGPSVRDIASELDVSTSTMHRHLMGLVESGSLEVNQGLARTWRPVQP